MSIWAAIAVGLVVGLVVLGAIQEHAATDDWPAWLVSLAGASWYLASFFAGLAVCLYVFGVSGLAPASIGGAGLAEHARTRRRRGSGPRPAGDSGPSSSGGSTDYSGHDADASDYQRPPVDEDQPDDEPTPDSGNSIDPNFWLDQHDDGVGDGSK